MQETWLTVAFTTALVASLVVKIWLASRQMRHVAAHRNAVPPPFDKTISLAAHQRAADYTLAKGRFGLITTAFGPVSLSSSSVNHRPATGCCP